jgi:hypothetical protein
MDQVISSDDTRIAHDRLGSGPAVLLIGAGPADRRPEAPLAGWFAGQALHRLQLRPARARRQRRYPRGALVILTYQPS